MELAEETLDDLMHGVLSKLIDEGVTVTATRGEMLEIHGACLRLKNPLARVSRSEGRGRIFSAIGELFWYLTGSNDLQHIEYYIPRYREESADGRMLHGAYGPRLFGLDGQNQIENVLALLGDRPNSRRAVVQLFRATDIADTHLEIPCTCTIQFLLRENHLHMLVHMRSNDAYLGVPHDFFAFTMLQEIVARTLSVELGEYVHFVGSLHLYTCNLVAARRYLEEGYQSTLSPMPPMPNGDPWPEIRKATNAERTLREGEDVDPSEIPTAPYWQDIIRLLKVQALVKRGEHEALSEQKSLLHSRVFERYIEEREERARRHEVAST